MNFLKKQLPKDNGILNSKMTNLIHTIQQAFSGITLGNGIGLSEGNAMDDYASAEERTRCREQDEHTHWHKIPVELLNQYYIALCYFDPEGMRFHLPAFLIADIQGLFRFDLVYTFIHLDEYKEQQFSLLSAPQKQAVAAYLHWIPTAPNHYISSEDTVAIDQALLFWEE